jgi:uncharacterized protein (DUF1501 family)
MELDRRGLLVGGISCLFARRALASGELRADEGPVLVLVQLTGGNDGLSTVVPLEDDVYGRARSTTRIAASEALVLDERRGLHPALTRLRELHAKGALALVEGVGYPAPRRSHFQSLEVWHSAENAGRASEGWIGRLARAVWGEEAPRGSAVNRIVHVGPRPPFALHSSLHPPVAFTAPNQYRRAGSAADLATLDGLPDEGDSTLAFLRGVERDALSSSRAVREAVQRYEPRAEYPAEPFGHELRAAAALIDGGLGVRIVSLELDGFDTHAEQRRRHDRLMATLDAALGAFLADLERSEAGKEALVLVFSEFGRRVEENGSGGTDHGCAAPLFVLGCKIRGGLYGQPSSLAELVEGDLAFTTDFRSVYATAIERCFGVPHERVLGERYPLLGFA